ncbi:MAG: hypothetical protein QOF37_2578 [Thermoleophilaceae bacterium]|nr:hypothetical protein [Thermoleophilaceae bacterium]
MRRWATVGSLLVALGLLPAAASASFPGANGRIVFTQDNGGTGRPASWRVMSMAPDGSGLSVLASGGAGSAAASADGSRIAFERTRKKNAGIYVMRADGAHARRISTKPGSDFAWAPDSSAIAFVRGAEVRAIGVNGGAERVIAGGGASSPSWAPDGSRIAFVRGGSVFTVSSSGGGEQMVIAGAVSPDWSPDASRLAYARPTGVFSSRLDGSGEAGQPGANSQPDWSPDSQRIAFAHTQGNVVTLTTMAPDGTGVSAGPRFDHMVDFDWAPDTPVAPLKTFAGTVAATQPVRSVLARGLRVPFGCAVRCNVTADVLASRSALHGAKLAVLGHGGVHLPAVGSGPLVIRMRPSARRALKRVSSLPATLRIRIVPDSGHAVAASQSITFSR